MAMTLLTNQMFSLREKLPLSLLLLLALSLNASEAFAQGTVFTYQGRLTDGGTAANGSYDLQFTLWDALSGGTQQPQPSPVTVMRNGVAVANGIFTLQLDFGPSANAFPGADRFLEIGVRPAGSGNPFTILTPRQPVTSTPYAVRALSATTADNLTTTGSGSFIQNTTSQQSNSNFNISGNGTAGLTLSGNTVNAATQYNIGGIRVVSIPGANNIFVGAASGASNTTGENNAFFGREAGVFNTVGSNNSFFGYSAGHTNTSSFNSFFGFQAGLFNTLGSDNSFFGVDAGLNNTEGSFNSFFGRLAGERNTLGGSNSFFGGDAGGLNTTGNFNSFFGNAAGFRNATGGSNTLIGFSAGNANVTGNSNTYIGSFADGANGINNATAIGAHAQVSQSDSLVLGSISGLNNAAASVNVGIGTQRPSYPLTVSGAAGSGQFQGAVEFNNSSNDTGVRISNTAASGRTWTLFSSGGSTGLCAGCFSIYDATSGIRRLTLDPIGNVQAGETLSGANFVQSAPVGWGDAYRIFRGGSQVASIGMDSTATKLRLFVGASSDNSTVQVSVDSLGNVKARGQVTSNTTPDIAETIPADASVTAGDIVCADPLHREHVVRCSNRDRAVLGVISDGTGGFLINSNGKSPDAALTGKPLVLAGRVPVKVSLENGPIQSGDFLTASSTPGVAMRASDLGPTIGIALEAFTGEEGPPRNQRRFGTVLCFVKGGEGDTKAALARMSQSLMRMSNNNRRVTDENRRLQQENASLKTRLDRLEQQQNEVKQQQNQILPLKKLVCLDHPVADICKRKN